MPEQALGALFSDYVLDANYDEMFESAGMARPHCRALLHELRGASEAELSLRQLEQIMPQLTRFSTQWQRPGDLQKILEHSNQLAMKLKGAETY